MVGFLWLVDVDAAGREAGQRFRMEWSGAVRLAGGDDVPRLNLQELKGTLLMHDTQEMRATTRSILVESIPSCCQAKEQIF